MSNLNSMAKITLPQVWKKIFPAADELEKVVRRQANEWKTLSFTKKSKMTDFWSRAVQKIKWQTSHSQQ